MKPSSGMRILTVSGRLPTSSTPGSQAFIMRQIRSLRPYCSVIDSYQVVGNKVLKHLQSAVYISRVASHYDIIHVHYGMFAFGPLVARHTTPIVLSLMGSDVFGTPGNTGKVTALTAVEAVITKYLAHRCDSVIAKNRKMLHKITNPNSYVVPNGVDLKQFRPMPMSECRKHLGWSSDTMYILFPGNPARSEKNWGLAQKAVEAARNSTRKSILLLPLNNVLPEKVPVYINAADLVLMTSYSEGSPNVVKEALACNKQVISVDVGDVAEIISGVGGCSIVGYDALEIATEITNTIDRGNTLVEGRKRLRELNLDLDSVAKRIIDIYKETIRASG